MSRRNRILAIVAGIGVLAGLAIGALRLCESCSRALPWLSHEEASAPLVRVIYKDTEFYELERKVYRHWIEMPQVQGGGIDALGTDFLLATGDGVLYSFREKRAGEGLEVRKLAYHVPLDSKEFEDDSLRLLAAPVESQWFRVADLLVQERPDSVRLFVSHHYWKRDEKCTVLRVSLLEGSREQLLAAQGGLSWRTIFETQPCLKLNTDGARGSHFAGLEVGGRLAASGADTLLLSVGDHEFDGWNRMPAFSPDPAASYGKVLLVHVDTGQAEIYSRGHRNPQGLVVAKDGTIWSTEHGPRGGDEVNHIQRGADYGWPAVTYGTDYSMHRWPQATVQGRHEGYEKPIFAYVPSAGISQLAVVSGSLFDLWKGDLLVSFLKGNRIERLRIEDGRAIYSEPIGVQDRVRDLIEAPDGRLVLWTDEGNIQFVAPSKRRSGESLVFQCTGCHALQDWEPSKVGPRLWAVVGRDVASLEDFRYSQALRDHGGEWTRERLGAFLENPRRAVPGTTMQYAGMHDPAERAQLIDYLESLSR